MSWDTYNYTDLEIVPIGGPLVAPEPEEVVEEGEFVEIPDDPYMGGRWGEPGWIPPEDVTPTEPIISTQSDSRKRREKEVARILKRERELEDLRRKAEKEEYKSKVRQYRREHRPQVGKTIRTWLKPRPQTDLAKIFFPGKALRDTYIPRPPVRTTTEQIRELQKVTKPDMGLESSLGQAVQTQTSSLRRASNPPPSPVIRAPTRNPEEFEGVGPALIRLRKLGEMKRVDQAVLAEVQANGDIDTPTHVKSEVSRLGFTVSEVDTSLKRLRNLGFIVPTGRVYNGEKELMLSGGSHG